MHTIKWNIYIYTNGPIKQIDPLCRSFPSPFTNQSSIWPNISKYFTNINFPQKFKGFFQIFQLATEIGGAKPSKASSLRIIKASKVAATKPCFAASKAWFLGSTRINGGASNPGVVSVWYLCGIPRIPHPLPEIEGIFMPLESFRQMTLYIVEAWMTFFQKKKKGGAISFGGVFLFRRSLDSPGVVKKKIADPSRESVIHWKKHMRL